MPLPKPEDITYISPDELPDSVAEHLIDRAVYLGHTSINYISDFGRFMKLEDPDGYSIFFSMADHSYPISDTKDTLERRIYAVDSIEREQVVGYGGVSSSLTSQTDFALNKPLVLGIETYGGFRERGFGRRRYLGMNAASLLMFGLPIHSREKGHMLSDLATRRWEAFVQEGLAEAYEQVLDFPPGRKIQRYRFKA